MRPTLLVGPRPLGGSLTLSVAAPSAHYCYKSPHRGNLLSDMVSHLLVQYSNPKACFVRHRSHSGHD